MVILNVPFFILALVLVNYDNSGEYYMSFCFVNESVSCE